MCTKTDHQRTDRSIQIRNKAVKNTKKMMLDDEQGDKEEDSVPVFTEYVGLRGSSWHQDC